MGRTTRTVGLCALLLAPWTPGCGETCPFQNTGVLSRNGVLEPGAGALHDVSAPAESDLEIDLSNSSSGGRVDAWLTTTDCAQLFEGAYASGAPPRCAVLIGPVAPGAVSSRQKAQGGTYRIFVYAPASNTQSSNYAVGFGTWWHTCASPFAR